MVRFVLPVFALLASASAALAQEDYDLANALGERGWYDLSEELFERIKGSASLPPDQRAEGDYGLARIKMMMAEKADTAEEKSKLFDRAIKEIETFRTNHPKHRRAGDALSDISYLYQSKGKALMTASKADPTKTEEAEKAFANAEKLFQDLIAALKKEEKKRPEDPKKSPKEMDAYIEWEEKMMFAKYNYTTALFSHAETYRDNASKHPDMKRLLEQMVKFLNDDFMWQYESYLLAYDASIYVGRAYQLLAETSDREKAEDHWKQCFMNLARPKSLLSEADNRKNEDVREIAARALLFEMKARMTYGDIKRGQAGAKLYADAAKLAEDFFKIKECVNVRFEDIGKALRLEQARAYCKGGATDKGIKLLQDLKKEGKDTWVENLAVDYLGEYAGNESVQLAVESGDNLMDRGPAYYYKAIQKYRRALQAIRKPEDQKFMPRCWAQMGKCYFLLGRHYEAVEALSVVVDKAAQSEYAAEAAMRMLTSLAKIKDATKDKADERRFEAFREQVRVKFPGAANEQLLRQTAIDADDKRDYGKAAEIWAQLAKPASPSFEEAIFSVGFSYYNLGQDLMEKAGKQRVQGDRDKLVAQAKDAWDRGMKAFRDHLGFVDKMQGGKEPRVVKRAIGAVYFATKILAHDRVAKPDEALKVSEDLEKRFPSADPKYVMAIMSSRIDAKLKLGQVQEAEEDLKALKTKFDKEGGLGIEHYSRALAVMANAFEAAAEKEKDKNAELYDLYAVKAATFYYEYYNLSPSSVSKPEQMEAMADKLFLAAEQRLKIGEAKLGKEGLEEVKNIFGKSRDLYNAFLLEKEKTLPKDVLSAIKGRMTRCLLMTGKFEEAVKIYEEIVKNDPQMRDGYAWESLSDCYVFQAKAMLKSAQRNELLKRADKVYAQLSAMLMGSQTFNEHTWRLLYKHADCLFELDLDGLRKFYDSMTLRGYAPRWDEDEKGVSKWGFREKFEALRKELDQRIPGRKP